jgi:hypothetical protein
LRGRPHRLSIPSATPEQRSDEADLTSIIRVVIILMAAASFIPFAAPARADAIDGDWCAKDGRHFFIQGPAITTPGGNAIRGNYRRHSFSYVVPPGETKAGEPIAMLLLNENRVAVQTGDTTEVWLRCKPAIS